MTLLDDLAQWESGELSRAELLVRNATADKNLAPEGGGSTDKNLGIASSAADLEAILELHERLTAIGSEPVPYKASDWERVRAGLPDRITRKRSARRAAGRATTRRGFNGRWPERGCRGRVARGSRAHDDCMASHRARGGDQRRERFDATRRVALRTRRRCRHPCRPSDDPPPPRRPGPANTNHHAHASAHAL